MCSLPFEPQAMPRDDGRAMEWSAFQEPRRRLEERVRAWRIVVEHTMDAEHVSSDRECDRGYGVYVWHGLPRRVYERAQGR